MDCGGLQASRALLGISLLLALSLIAPCVARALPLGTVTNNGAVKCPSQVTGTPATGAVCYAVTVSCPNTVDLSGWVAVASPPGAIGTITMMGAGPGTHFFTDVFANKYLNLGYQTAQIAFQTVWEDSGMTQGSVLAAACRPATLFNWVYENFHRTGTAQPYCLQGFSGGSGAVSYALSHYGLKSITDAAMFTAGPAMGDMYRGCTQGGPGRLAYNAIPECGPGWFDYYTIFPTVGDVLSYPDKWEHTTTCSNNPTLADASIWASTSIDTEPADYTYPQTKLSSFQCTGNGAPGQAMFYFNNVEANSPSSLSAFACDHGGAGGGATACDGESYWLDYGTGAVDQTRFSQMVDQMHTDCVARH